MMMMMRASWIVGLGLALVACEKSDPGAGMGRPSKIGSTDEAALLHDLPKGNQLLFGGNFMRLQKFMQDSPLAKLASALNSKTPGADAWQSCFVDGPGLTMMGSVAYANGTIDVRYVMRGMDLDKVDACAKKASFPSALDADHKFLSVEMSTASGTLKSGYLVLADGALLTRMQLSPSHLGTFPTTDRAMLEADVAGLAHGTAADDATLIDAMPKVDHSKPVWLVASGAGTPIADKVGLVTATFDVTDGFGFDVTAQLKDAALATQITEGAARVKKQAGMLGEDIAAIAEQAKVDRDGDTVHLAVTVTNAQLDAITKRLAPMMGAH